MAGRGLSLLGGWVVVEGPQGNPGNVHMFGEDQGIDADQLAIQTRGQLYEVQLDEDYEGEAHDEDYDDIAEGGGEDG